MDPSASFINANDEQLFGLNQMTRSELENERVRNNNSVINSPFRPEPLLHVFPYGHFPLPEPNIHLHTNQNYLQLQEYPNSAIMDQPRIPTIGSDTNFMSPHIQTQSLQRYRVPLLCDALQEIQMQPQQNFRVSVPQIWPLDDRFRRPMRPDLHNVAIRQNINEIDEIEYRPIREEHLLHPNINELQANKNFARSGLQSPRTEDFGLFSYPNVQPIQSPKSSDTLGLDEGTTRRVAMSNLNRPVNSYFSQQLYNEINSSEIKQKTNSLFVVQLKYPEKFRKILMRFYWRVYLWYIPSQVTEYHEGQFSNMTQQIWRYFSSNQPTFNLYNFKLAVCRQFQILLDQKRPLHEYKVFITGSTVSGLSLNNSDVDICLVTDKRQGIQNRYDSIFHLQCIQYVLETVREVDSIKLIDAKVPVLRFNVSGDYHIEVDVNCNNIVTIANTQLLYAYTKCDWRLQPFHSIVKQWTIFHDLNSSYKSCLSSYSISLLVIQFLQCGVSPPVLPCLHKLVKKEFKWKDVAEDKQHKIGNLWCVPFKSENRQTLGELLYQFFKFYSEMDLTKNVYSVRLGRIIPKEEYICVNNITSLNSPIYIEDPFTLANTAYAVVGNEPYWKIKWALHGALETILTNDSLEALFR